jgi:cytochrome P450
MALYFLSGGVSTVAAVAATAVLVLKPKKTAQHRTGPDAPVFYDSYTSLGPIELFVDPMSFIEERNRELSTEIFSAFMGGAHTTFITNAKDIEAVMSKENADIFYFPGPYLPAIQATFSEKLLTPKMFAAQRQLLCDYLTPKHLNAYLNPSLKLSKSILATYGGSGKTVVVDFKDIALDTVFGTAIRNFLGDELVEYRKSYSYNDAFNGFDLVKSAVPILFPNVYSIYQRYIKAHDAFDKAVISIIRKREAQFAGLKRPEHGGYNNVLDEIIARRYEKGEGSLTDGDLKVLLNLVKLFVFGTGLNSYAFVVYMIYWLLEDPATRWEQLRAEQLELVKTYGEDLSPEKLMAMKQLIKALDQRMGENCFPLLLRQVMQDFKLPGTGKVLPAGGLVAFSPRMQYALKQLDIVFGAGAHTCPAEGYARRVSMQGNLAVILLGIKRIIRVVSAVKPANKRLITFPNFPPILAEVEFN